MQINTTNTQAFQGTFNAMYKLAKTDKYVSNTPIQTSINKDYSLMSIIDSFTEGVSKAPKFLNDEEVSRLYTKMEKELGILLERPTRGCYVTNRESFTENYARYIRIDPIGDAKGNVAGVVMDLEG